MTEVVTAPATAKESDRSAGLLTFGFIHLLLGTFCMYLVLGAAAGSELASRRGLAVPQQAFVSVLLVYGGAALYFIAVGIGSLRRRRWARALGIVMSAMWLAGGVVGGIAGLLLQRRDTGFVILWLFFGVALPLAILLFYRRDDVRVTLERYDFKGRWTDRVPLAVLAVVLLMAFGSIALLVNVANPVVPLFGNTLTGPIAAITTLALAVLFAFTAMQLYLLKESAWWTVVLLQIAGCMITAGNLLRSAARQNVVVWAIIIASWISYLAYLFFVRRYFVTVRPKTRADDVPSLSRA